MENALVLNLTLNLTFKILSSAFDKEVFLCHLPCMGTQGRNSVETTEAVGRKMQKRLRLL